VRGWARGGITGSGALTVGGGRRSNGARPGGSAVCPPGAGATFGAAGAFGAILFGCGPVRRGGSEGAVCGCGVTAAGGVPFCWNCCAGAGPGATGGFGAAGGGAAAGGAGRCGGAASGAGCCWGAMGGAGRCGGAAAGGGGGGAGRGAAAGGGAGRCGGAAAGGAGRGGGGAGGRAAGGAGRGGGAPFGGGGFFSGSAACAITCGAVCACDEKVANGIAERAVVASSTRRSLVMMIWVPGKTLAANAVLIGQTSRSDDQRIRVRPDCGGLQRRSAFYFGSRKVLMRSCSLRIQTVVSNRDFTLSPAAFRRRRSRG
jgi:hypothetical protein